MDPTLISPMFRPRPHESGGELEEGIPGGQPVGHVEQALVSAVAGSSEGFGQDMLLKHRVKS